MWTLFERLKRLARRRDLASDLAEEIETHRLMTERRLRESGMTAADAAATSRRIMGNASLAREDARAVWVWSWLDSTRQDISYALRSLRRRPGFASLAVVTLGAAIGVNTTLFTVFDAVSCGRGRWLTRRICSRSRSRTMTFDHRWRSFRPASSVTSRITRERWPGSWRRNAPSSAIRTVV